MSKLRIETYNSAFDSYRYTDDSSRQIYFICLKNAVNSMENMLSCMLVQVLRESQVLAKTLFRVSVCVYFASQQIQYR